MKDIKLRVKKLNVEYIKDGNSFKAVSNISFSLKAGEVISIIGESGSGKSSLAKALIGLLPVSAKVKGEMGLYPNFLINLESDLNVWSKIRGRKIAYIFQDAQEALNPMMTINDHFKETLLNHFKMSDTEIYKISKEYLEYLNFKDADKILRSYPFELSGGMCQRVCIALCLVLKPEILIADEATSALDVLNQMEIINLLKKIQKDFDLSIIFITHDITVARLIADRIIVMYNGTQVEKGTVEDVFKKPSSDYTKKIIYCNKCLFNLKDKREDMVLNNLSKPLLEIEGVNKRYKNNGFNALSDIGIKINERETVGILGESGCGKSTLAKCIIGLEDIDSGEIFFDGERIDKFRKKGRKQIYRKMQMIFQDARNSLNPRRKTIELVNEPNKYMKIYNREDDNPAQDILKEVAINTIHFNSRPPQLSTGQCQRVAIARALMVKPKLLICDEIVSALDVENKLQILKLLLNVRENYNTALIMISHDIQFLKSICDRILIMQDGHIVDEFNICCEDNSCVDKRSTVNELLYVAKEMKSQFVDKI
ncbi:ABC transporter ATP-binding protein [Tissierella praeacuta]|uniref:ABC transporter ATP-binding protein n=1 Tax=Tissierella praeacuta TaxID=43131 RepID=UPI003517880C